MNTAAALAVFAAHRAQLEKKPLLRKVYCEDFFSRLRGAARAVGPTIEVGSGAGWLRPVWPEIIATDLVPQADVNAAMDACHLAFATGSVANIVGVDVLHHLPFPFAFLHEAVRVLRPEGRLVLIEPWLTPFSRFIYRHFHHEVCDENVDPFGPDANIGTAKEPLEGNQALPYLLFGPGRERTLSRLPQLRLEKLERLGGIAYLLSLGYRPQTLAPGWSFGFLRTLEQVAAPIWNPLGSLRVLIVLRRAASG